MVGLLCGCCQASDELVPGGCTVCDLLWSGYPADVRAFSDNFSEINPGWRLLSNWEIPYKKTAHPTDPLNTVPPNSVTDYIRSNHLHFFRSPFINFFDIWTNANRCFPPEPVPSTIQGRQPWLNVIRRANLYFPKSQQRNYRFEITLNYPADTLPRIGDPDWRPLHGTVGLFAIGPASFYVFPDGLGVATDNNSSAVLKVGIQLTKNPEFPQWVPLFEQTVTVPFGEVKLRFEYTYQPQTGIGVRRYYVNDVLVREVSASGFFFSPTTGTDCVSACGTIVQLAGYEPWRIASSPPNSGSPLWGWSGFIWLRGGGNAAVPPPSFNTVSWLAANNPAEKLWFDDYAMSIVSP